MHPSLEAVGLWAEDEAVRPPRPLRFRLPGIWMLYPPRAESRAPAAVLNPKNSVAAWYIPCPKVPKYLRTGYRHRNIDFGNIFDSWALGPLGMGLKGLTMS